MALILGFIVLFCIVQFSYISSSLRPEVMHLINSDYLLVNGDGLFRFKIDNLNKIEKIKLFNEDQNLLANQNNNQNIYRFKCFEENICIFINNFIYIFSSDGNIIKKINISDENNNGGYIIAPYNIALKDLNTFNYILFTINSKGNLLYYFYSLNNNSYENLALIKNEIPIFEKERSFNLKEIDFTCQLIPNSIICFFSNGNNNGILIKNFSVDFEKKKIKLINFSVPEVKLNFNGKIIKSLLNKGNSRIFILYSTKDSKNNKARQRCTIYNIKSNKLEFLTEINDVIDNYNNYSKRNFGSISNVEYHDSIKKYILYCLNRKNELFIIELDENFKIEKTANYILENKSFEIINFSLINYNRNYQIILLAKKNNSNINNNGSIIISSYPINYYPNNFIRNLEDKGGNNNPGQGGDIPDQKEESDSPNGGNGGGDGGNKDDQHFFYP